jgi:hypothetical protein
MQHTIIRNNEQGFVLIVALLVMVVLTIIGIAATRNTSLELMISGNDKVHKRTLYQAEAGAVLSTEVLEQNINCLTGFTKTSTDPDFADIEGSIRTWSRTSHNRNKLAFYLDPAPWTTSNCNITDPTGPNISYPISNINTSVELSEVFVGGGTELLPGGSLQMAAGYERKGKSAAGGGTARLYDIVSRHGGLNNSESTIIFGWRHLVGEESGCKY